MSVTRNLDLKKAAAVAKQANLMELQGKIGDLIDSLICKLDEIDEKLEELEIQVANMGVDVVILRQTVH